MKFTGTPTLAFKNLFLGSRPIHRAMSDKSDNYSYSAIRPTPYALLPTPYALRINLVRAASNEKRKFGKTNCLFNLFGSLTNLYTNSNPNLRIIAGANFALPAITSSSTIAVLKN